MKALIVIGIFLLTVAMITLGLALGALIIWFFGNIVLNYFDIKPLTYGVSFAIATVLWFIGSLFHSSSSSK